MKVQLKGLKIWTREAEREAVSQSISVFWVVFCFFFASEQHSGIDTMNQLNCFHHHVLPPPPHLLLINFHLFNKHKFFFFFFTGDTLPAVAAASSTAGFLDRLRHRLSPLGRLRDGCQDH